MKSAKSKSKYYRRCKFCGKQRKALKKGEVKWLYFEGNAMCPFCVIEKFGAFI